VAVTPQQALALPVGSAAHLFTTLIVREDDLSLYGFATEDELVIFDLLRGVTGVGPKSALGVLGHLTPSQIATAVASEDDAAFRRVSGIGPKTAKLIVVQLTGKLDIRIQAPSVTAKNTTAVDVLIALIGLGWSERDAQAAIDSVLDDADASVTTAVPALLRATLTRLGPQRSGAGR
jgi:Holliday junction DNA helicase RuvA